MLGNAGKNKCRQRAVPCYCHSSAGISSLIKMETKMQTKIKTVNRLAAATTAPAPAPAPAPAAAPVTTEPSPQEVSDARAILQLVAAADIAAAAVRLAERAELVVRTELDGETRLDFKRHVLGLTHCSISVSSGWTCSMVAASVPPFN